MNYREQIEWQREVAAVFALDCKPKQMAIETADSLESLLARNEKLEAVLAAWNELESCTAWTPMTQQDNQKIERFCQAIKNAEQ